MKKRISTLVAAGGLGLALIAAATTQTVASTGVHMETAGRTLTPIGHDIFCRSVPQECSQQSHQTQAPKLTRKRWSQIVSVNSRVNRAIRPVTDQEFYGVEEHWTFPDDYGDCEDYVLLKRHMLMKMGWPPSSLLITVVKQDTGEGHAVLTVRTERGDYILDNLVSEVKVWNKTNYRYLKRQSTRHSGRWVSIRDSRRQVAMY